KINFIAITGGDKKLYERIKKDFRCNHFLAVNWTDVMDEYMKMSDFVIGKPGGLISSECMSIKRLLVVVGLIPGVEYYNARYMEKNMFGVDATNKRVRKEIIEKTIFSKNFRLHENPTYKENPAKNIVNAILQPK
ncbi:MAG: glycosyltransferase, partial [Candidatus Staskawiczbacteria bacterium]|nr:glycosyltransferase [Candidatus Staskawiczbacteria bacterium]